MPSGKRKAVYGKTHAECRKYLDELKRQLDDGTFSDTDFTVASFLKRWLQHRQLEVKPKTLSEDCHQCENHIVPKIGKVKLIKLSALQVQDMMLELATEISPSNANRSRKVLRNALGQALRWQLIARNPVDATKKLKEEKTAMTLWTYEEAGRFLTTAKNHRLYPLFLLTMSTGMRRSEVLGLRWQDVQGSEIHVCHTGVQVDGNVVFSETTKTHHSNRTISISDDVVAALREYRDAQRRHYERLGFVPPIDLAFDSLAGTPLSPRNLERAYKTLKEKAEVASATFHDLRHWHASMLIEEGWDIRLIAQRLGHADPSITLRTYTHLINQHQQPVAVNLSSILPLKDDSATA